MKNLNRAWVEEYTDEALEEMDVFKPTKGSHPKTKRERLQRRRLKEKRLNQAIKYFGGYAPHIGFYRKDLGKDLVDGELANASTHLILSGNSWKKKYIKRMTTAKVRNSKELYRRGNYRKGFDYWRLIYY